MDEQDRPEAKWGVELITEGEWAGWKRRVRGDSFEGVNGPFYFRNDLPGGLRAAFRAEQRHMNAGGFMHGGCTLTFADSCLFMIARPQLKGRYGVTVTLNGEFAGSAHVGDLVEGSGEIVKTGGSLIFVRGLVSTAGEPMLNFSGIIKIVKPRS